MYRFMFAAFLVATFVFAANLGSSDAVRCYVGEGEPFEQWNNCTICKKMKVSLFGFGGSTSSCETSCQEGSGELFGVGAETSCCSTDLCNSAWTLAGPSVRLLSLSSAAATGFILITTAAALRC